MEEFGQLVEISLTYSNDIGSIGAHDRIRLPDVENAAVSDQDWFVLFAPRNVPEAQLMESVEQWSRRQGCVGPCSSPVSR